MTFLFDLASMTVKKLYVGLWLAFWPWTISPGWRIDYCFCCRKWLWSQWEQYTATVEVYHKIICKHKEGDWARICKVWCPDENWGGDGNLNPTCHIYKYFTVANCRDSVVHVQGYIATEILELGPGFQNQDVYFRHTSAWEAEPFACTCKEF